MKKKVNFMLIVLMENHVVVVCVNITKQEITEIQRKI
jgi:hypothetical protein